MKKINLEYIEINTKLEIDQDELNRKIQELQKVMEELRATSKSNCGSEKKTFNITCTFDDCSDDYCCKTEDVEINAENMKIDQVFGEHLQSNTNSDVKELSVDTIKMIYLSKDIFKTFLKLETVTIENTSIEKLSSGDFKRATNVKTLSMCENKIKSLDDHVFEGAEKLNEIKMDTNFINEISSNAFKGLSKLKKLSLKENLIEELHVETFKDLVSLSELILTSNEIKFLDGKVFQFNTKLSKLYLDQNKLEGIGEDILNYSKSLKRVDFNQNTCIKRKLKSLDLEAVKDEIKTKCNYFDDRSDTMKN